LRQASKAIVVKIIISRDPPAQSRRFSAPEKQWRFKIQHGKYRSVLGSLLKSKQETPSGPQKFGRYYLQELISSGGMAEIWLATDEHNKAFALRRMHERLRFNLGARRRFVRGCEILERIGDHKNIIGHVEHGKIDGQLYLLMEYVEGANLKELYRRQDPVLAENVAQILIDMAEALEHMHEVGYMHLDFKPENVLVTRNASVRLLDFDLAQQIPEKPFKHSNKNPGTPSYMAPEQLMGLPISNRVDIFAFGVAAYELVTTKPFPVNPLRHPEEPTES
jgi:serine/threonine-protein kinase